MTDLRTAPRGVVRSWLAAPHRTREVGALFTSEPHLDGVLRLSESYDAVLFIDRLYLVQLALDGAGDRDAAAAVRKRMRALESVTVLTPVVLTWVRADEAAEGSPQFSPKYPMGSRPAR